MRSTVWRSRPKVDPAAVDRLNLILGLSEAVIDAEAAAKDGVAAAEEVLRIGARRPHQCGARVKKSGLTASPSLPIFVSERVATRRRDARRKRARGARNVR